MKYSSYISGKFYTFSDILDYARCTENFSIFCYWAFIIFISKTFSHENGDHKIEYSISTWHTELESSCLSCVCLKPLQFETIHFFWKWIMVLKGPITTFLFLFFSLKTIPCTIQGQDGIMSCQVWHRYAINKIYFFFRYTC